MKDLTQGSITRLLVAMAVPIAIGMLFQTLYFLIDLIFVSRIGDAAIAGVSSAGTATFIILGLTQMLASTPTFNPVVGANAAVSPTQLALAALLSVAPVLVIFLVAQRFLVTGLTAGGTKG